MRVDPYAERDEKSSPYSLCGVGQSNLYFVGQVWGEPMQGRPTRYIIPSFWDPHFPEGLPVKDIHRATLIHQDLGDFKLVNFHGNYHVIILYWVYCSEIIVGKGNRGHPRSIPSGCGMDRLDGPKMLLSSRIRTSTSRKTYGYYVDFLSRHTE